MIESDTHTDAECENGKPHGEAPQAESPTCEQTTEASPSAVAPSSISPAIRPNSTQFEPIRLNFSPTTPSINHPGPSGSAPSTINESQPPSINHQHSTINHAFTHRGNGKIARLPKIIRDQINNWILDGVPYPDIIERLGEHGKDLNPGHFTEYKKRGYQDWLRQLDWFEHVTAKSEFSKDLLASPDTSALHEAGLRMAAAQMLDQLMQLGATIDAENENSKPDPDQFARLVNALSRLTREALAFQKYRDACALARAALQDLKDPHRKLSESETRAIVRKVDEILGLVSHPAAILPDSEISEPGTETHNPNPSSTAITGGPP